MLEVRLLGQFDVCRNGTAIVISSRAAQSLCAYLLLTAGTMHRREKLAGLLWADTTDENARKNLRHELWRLRQAIEIKNPRKKVIPYLLVDEISIGFNAESDYWLDVSLVQKPLSEKESADKLIEILSPYRGELLPGLYDDWVVLERERVQAIFEQKMARLLELLIESKHWQEILDWGERWISFGQTPEPAYRALMLAHSASGNRSQAAVVYERCVRAMRDDLGVEPSEQTRRLFEQLSKKGEPAKTIETRTAIDLTPPPIHESEIAKESAATIEAPSPSRSSKLPVPPTSFIGRQKELKEIEGLLSSSRLLTLTGSGGVGKTRLAIQTAYAVPGKFKDGVFWVDLVGLSNANLISQEIAQSLRVSEVPNVPLIETLKNDLAAKNLLLVLDNCEHLIASAAQTAEQLVSACPNLKILATSRERLGIFNETVWHVPSLSENTRRQLFVERARAAQHDFTLTPANESFVEQICARLDGIPLAIELAAARMAILSVEEIARRLDDRFALLTSGSRTALPRQQTLRAMIDWSYDLLSEPERILFRRLAVFAGGFTLDAAEAVCTHGELKRNNVLDALGRLIDKSLAIVEQAAPVRETRYRLLETIREYALEKLIETGEAPAIRDQHLEYYLALTEKAEALLFSGEQATWVRLLDTELDNVRAVIEWATNTGKADVALRIAGSLVYYWFAHRLASSEWQSWVQRAITRPEGKTRTLDRAKALNGIGFMYFGDVVSTDRRPELEEALSIAREFGDQWNTATALRNLGLMENVHGNYLEARSYLEASLAIWREMGLAGKFGYAWTLVFLGDVALNRGEAELARTHYEEVVTILRGTGDINFLAYAVRRLGQLLWREGEYEKAGTLCKESLSLNQQVDSPRGVIACLAGFAAIAVVQGKYQYAAQLMGAVESQMVAMGITSMYMDQQEYERNRAVLKERLDEKTLVQFWSQGKAMSMEQAIAFATSFVEERKMAEISSNNLPIPLTSFIGREKELAEIMRFLSKHRLVTLTGPGGVGKTRLAIQTANGSIEKFRDGVWWVELAPLMDETLVPQAVAQALGVRQSSSQPLTESLKIFFRDKHLLIVLDNCEHLITACAQLADMLLSHCANLRILATSREALGITGETLYQVPTLSVPEPQRLTLTDLLMEYESIRLFVERACAVKSDFTLTEQNAAAVLEICQRLDGIPLALELAAARVKLLTVEHIAERLNDRFNLLTQGSRTALPRQQTLRAAIDWSYDQLPEDTRILFQRLSVFAGGFTLEAAEEICSEAPLTPHSLLDQLARLVDRSLIKVERQGNYERYRMLETIREYTCEKLEASGETGQLRQRHRDFFIAFAEQAEPKLKSAEQFEWLDRLEIEHDNWRAAWECAIESDAELALRLASALLDFWSMRGNPGEGREWLAKLLPRTEQWGQTARRAHALSAACRLAYLQRDFAVARLMLEQALAIARKSGDQKEIALALLWLGWTAHRQRDDQTARPFIEECLTIYEELQDPWGMAMAIYQLAGVEAAQGHYAEAEERYMTSRAKFQELGDKFRMGYPLNGLGELARLLGDYARAGKFYEEHLELLRAQRSRLALLTPSVNLAWVSLHQGNHRKAQALFEESLELCNEYGNKTAKMDCLAGFASILGMTGKKEQAVWLFGAVEALLESIGMGGRMDPSDQKEFDHYVAAVRAQLDETAFAKAWAEGRTMTLEQAVGFALAASGG